MASLKIRYEGNVIEIPEGFEYNPQSFGTARLNYRVNSTKVNRLGLTTNTNARDYCKLAFRVKGQICYIGRASSISYLSGSSVDYNGSIVGIRDISIGTSLESRQSAETSSIDVLSSSMSVSTSSFTQVTSTQQIETSSWTQAIETASGTQQVWTNSSMYTRNAGSGSFTSAANPTIKTVTNATGSTITSNTASQQLVQSSSTNSISINTGYQIATYAANPGTSAYWSGNSYYNRSKTASEKLVKSSSTGAVSQNNSYLFATYAANPSTSTYWSGNSYYNRSKTASEKLVKSSSTGAVSQNNGYQYCTSAANPGTGGWWTGNSYYNKTRTASEKIVSKSTTSASWRYLNAKGSTSYSIKNDTANIYNVTFSRTYSRHYKYTQSVWYNTFNGPAQESYIDHETTLVTNTKSIGYYTLTKGISGTETRADTSPYYDYISGSTDNSKESSYLKTLSSKRSFTAKYSRTSSAAGSTRYRTSYISIGESLGDCLSAGTLSYYSYSTRWSAWASSYYRQSYYTYSTRWSAFASSYYRQSYYTYSTRWSASWASSEKYTVNYYRTDTTRAYSTRTNRAYSTRSFIGTTYYTSITRSTTSVSEIIHNFNI